MSVLERGALAPHFTLLGLDGREYSLSGDVAGQPLLLVFAKTGCGACDLALPYLERLREAYEDGWVYWIVAQDPPEAAGKYARQLSLNATILIDAPAYAVSKLYDPPATPTMFLIGTDGRVLYQSHGFAKTDINEVSEVLAGLVGAAPVEAAPEGDGRPPMRPG
jgi:peroxiredoxin